MRLPLLQAYNFSFVFDIIPCFRQAGDFIYRASHPAKWISQIIAINIRITKTMFLNGAGIGRSVTKYQSKAKIITAISKVISIDIYIVL